MSSPAPLRVRVFDRQGAVYAEAFSADPDAIEAVILAGVSAWLRMTVPYARELAPGTRRINTPPLSIEVGES